MDFAMQVYIELAVLENFCMDFTLLYAAKAAVKNAASAFRIALAAACGAGFAVAFPLLGLDGAWAVAVKLTAGAALCLMAAKPAGVRGYIKFCGAFSAFCAVVGGALIGIFSLAGIRYEQGSGYILSSVPAGIPLFCALLAVLGAKKLAARLQKSHKPQVDLRIYGTHAHVELKGFFDSGNKVYHYGAPVSIIDKDAAQKLVDLSRIKDGVKIHTVAGTKTIRVFTADRMEICSDGTVKSIRGVKIGISPRRIDCAVLHCDLLED